MSAPAAELTDSDLAALFADLFLARNTDRTSSNAVAAPSGGGLVDGYELARLLPTVAFWSLERHGKVELVPYQRRLDSMRGTDFHVVVRDTAKMPHLEGALLSEALRLSPRSDVSLYALARTMIKPSWNPQAAVVRVVHEHLDRAGYMQQLPVKRSLWQRANHQYATVFVGIPEQIEPLRKAANDVADQWWEVAEKFKPVGVQVMQAINTRLAHVGGSAP